MRLHRLHTLVIGQPHHREQLARDLVQLGMSAEFTETVDDALGRMQERMPDMIFLSVQGRTGSHIAFLKQLKEHNAEVMSVVMSNHLTPKECEDALAMGAYDCVTQPMHRNTLRIVVLRALKRHEIVQKARIAMRKREEQLTHFSEASTDLLVEIDSLKKEISELHAQIEGSRHPSAPTSGETPIL